MGTVTVTAAEYAQRHGISKKTVQRMIADGRLAAEKRPGKHGLTFYITIDSPEDSPPPVPSTQDTDALMSEVRRLGDLLDQERDRRVWLEKRLEERETAERELRILLGQAQAKLQGPPPEPETLSLVPVTGASIDDHGRDHTSTPQSSRRWWRFWARSRAESPIT